MQLALNRLAHSSIRIARFVLLPIFVLTAFLWSRSFSVDGIEFIVVDAITVVGIIASLLLCLLGIFWWCECGHGYADFALLVACIAPLAMLIYRLDPLAAAPIPL